jgi:hypothetical protein
VLALLRLRSRFRKQKPQKRWSKDRGSRGHENDDGVGRLRDKLGLQSDNGDDEGNLPARHHSDSHLKGFPPSLSAHGKAAANDLRENCQDRNDGRCQQEVSAEQVKVQAGTDGNEKVRGEKSILEKGLTDVNSA